ncbi:hypothetical protein AB1J06_08245 [Agrobacterium tumefaciens]
MSRTVPPQRPCCAEISAATRACNCQRFRSRMPSA